MTLHAPSSSSDKTWIVPAAVLGVTAAVAAVAHCRLLPCLGKYRSRVVGIIPARFASFRFPGKPLVRILGKPMIQVHRRRTWERAKLASALDRFGTERCYEALQKLEENYDIVVNIQGDEPLIEPEIMDGVVKSLQVREG